MSAELTVDTDGLFNVSTLVAIPVAALWGVVRLGTNDCTAPRLISSNIEIEQYTIMCIPIELKLLT
jgi:hypothetical protein